MIRVVDGRREEYIRWPLPGGWVCAEPDSSMPDGVCGMPVESEPCTVHHPYDEDDDVPAGASGGAR